jgi:hypothetical protein
MEFKLLPWERGALIGLLLLTAALRLYQLDAPLWFDEIMTLVHFVRQPVGDLVADYSSFNNHLFYSLQAKLAVTLFGEHPWALRLPAAAFGVAGVWALWRLARLALSGPEALLAAGLLALSYHHIWFSQNARGYTELMFWQVAALLLFIEGQGSRSWKIWGLFAVTLAAAMYTHMTAAFFIAALGLVYLGMLAIRQWAPAWAPQGFAAPEDLVARWAPMAGFVLGGVITLALCAPALVQMATLVSSVKSTSSVDVMKEYQNPLWTLAEGLRTLGAGGPMLLIGPCAALVAAIGWLGLARRQPVTAAVAIVHILVTLGALLALSMRLWPRFFFSDLVFVVLFLAHGAFQLAGWMAERAGRLGLDFARRDRVFALGAFIMLLASAVLAVRNYAVPKQNFPGPIALLQAEGAPAASVAAVGLVADAYADYLRPGWPRVETPEQLNALSASTGHRWAVVAFLERSRRNYAPLMAVLDRDYVVVRVFPGTLGDGALWVYRSKGSGV